MSLNQSKNHTANTATPLPTHRNITHLLPWLFSWEVYLILLVAAFLRLYQINTTEFDGDQAAILGMARDAVRFGLLPATSNAASIHIGNPPAVIYLLILPATLSADPLWAAVTVSSFNTIAVLLTYLFTRRYYGRLAGSVAALFYATAAGPLHYSRFIWQQNMVSPFVVLFMFALFWGVVERRQGWLVPALFLLGIAVQLHETSFFLVAPLLVALVLAPGTVRWRDLALSFVCLFIIFSTYLLWESSTKFADIYTVLQVAKRPAHIDDNSLLFYRDFLIPYDQPPTYPRSLSLAVVPAVSWLRYTMMLLALGGFVSTGVLLFRSRSGLKQAEDQDTQGTPPKIGVRAWWTNFRATPYKCGLLLLLVWQVISVLLLFRHSLPLFPHYLLVVLPGPFILLGIFLSKVVEWPVQHIPLWTVVIRYGAYALVGLIFIAQFVNSTAGIIDLSSGNFIGRNPTDPSYYNDVRSLQHALSEADQLAQQRHLNRIYITTDLVTQAALSYLADQVQTPTTLFDSSHCLVLPNPAQGPAVLLVGPYNELAKALLNKYATATLVDQPSRLGGPPFQLYMVTPGTTQSPSTTGTFGKDLQLLDVETAHLGSNNSLEMVTRWNLLRSAQPARRTTYNYIVTAQSNGTNDIARYHLCSFMAMRAGDQLLVAFGLSNSDLVPTSATLGVKSFTTTPTNPSYGPVHLETYIDNSTQWTTLPTTNGADTITVPIS